MIKFENVNINFNNFNLKNINLIIKKSTCHTILGPSGAGKSTIAKALLGLIKINSGKILYNSKDISTLDINKRGFGYVPQHLALFPHLKVEENLLFYKIKKDNFFHKVVEIANISHLLNRYPKTLSGGERQRVALVRAILTKSPLLILDEPFSALDINLKKELWLFVDTLKKEFNITILLITHDLNEAYFLSDNISILINGKIVQSDKKETVFNQPNSLSVAKYMGIKNIFEIDILNNQEFLIKELNIKYKIKNKLKSNSKFILIKDDNISFVDANITNSIKGEVELLEFQDYNLVLFKIETTQKILEIKVSKFVKITNYILLNPNNFIFIQK